MASNRKSPPSRAATKRPKRSAKPSSPKRAAIRGAAPSAGAIEYVARNTREAAGSAAALADLRFFSARAAAGQPLKFEALKAWMAEKHELPLGRIGMHSLCTRNGIQAWWAR